MFRKTSQHIEISQLIHKANLSVYVRCILSFNHGRNNFVLPKLYLKKLIEKQLNFSSSIFCSIWKTEQLFIIFFFHLSFQKVLYESALFFIIKVPYEAVLLSIITCHHLSLTYHTQKYFIKSYYCLATT